MKATLALMMLATTLLSFAPTAQAGVVCDQTNDCAWWMGPFCDPNGAAVQTGCSLDDGDGTYTLCPVYYTPRGLCLPAL